MAIAPELTGITDKLQESEERCQALQLEQVEEIRSLLDYLTGKTTGTYDGNKTLARRVSTMVTGVGTTLLFTGQSRNKLREVIDYVDLPVTIACLNPGVTSFKLRTADSVQKHVLTVKTWPALKVRCHTTNQSTVRPHVQTQAKPEELVVTTLPALEALISQLIDKALTARLGSQKSAERRECPRCGKKKQLTNRDPLDQTVRICRDCKYTGDCPGCGKKKPLNYPDPKDNTQRICRACWEESTTGQCNRCGETKPRPATDPQDRTKRICRDCWELSTIGDCPACGNNTQLMFRDPQDRRRNICRTCYYNSGSREGIEPCDPP